MGQVFRANISEQGLFITSVQI